MMKKRIILLSAALVACTLGAIAQDVTILHMKDGTQRRYSNGLKESTQMRFFEFSPEEQAKTIGHVTTSFYNDYSYQWPVTAVWHADKQYTVAVVWSDDIPENFNAQRGLCFGTKPGLTIDKCDTLSYLVDESINIALNSRFYRIKEIGIKYMIIGKKKYLEQFYYEPLQANLQLYRLTEDNCIPVDLQPGQTYYYRTFAQGNVLQDNQLKPVIFYGEEQSFRVPNVMMDSDYNTYPQFSDAAITQFATHFPDSVTAPTRAQLEPLWDKWRQTAQGAAYDPTPYISTKTFDDGTGYHLNNIPDEFCDWLIHREIVVDAMNFSELSKIQDPGSINDYDSIETIRPVFIDNVDASWGIPNNRWVRFEQLVTTTNHFVLYRNREVVPGIKYKLQVTFAPETDAEQSNLPCEVRIITMPVNISAYIPIDNPEVTTHCKAEPISGTEVTTLEYNNISAASMGEAIRIDTRVGSKDIRNGVKTRTLRIAQLRLIPE